jgi:predicted secreted protein
MTKWAKTEALGYLHGVRVSLFEQERQYWANRLDAERGSAGMAPSPVASYGWAERITSGAASFQEAYTGCVTRNIPI